MSFADLRLSFASQSLDFVIQHTITHSLSLAGATALPSVQSSVGIPQEQHIETLYIHIPFCHTLCRFCSFHKIKYNQEKALEYFQALRKEIRRVIEGGLRFNRVYIGGGTTTILEDELVKTIELIKSLTTVREVSCETDPSYFRTGHPEVLKGLVDRMSIGLQSFDDNILKASGRFEKFGSGDEQEIDIRRGIELFPTVNVDLMYGFKGQTPDSVITDIKRMIQLEPDQITTYPLTIGIGKSRKKSQCLAGEPKDLLSQFLAVKQVMSERYMMDFPWTYSRNFGQAVENKYVLDGENCFGVGSGAFGRFGEQFQISSFSIDKYIHLINQGGVGTSHHKILSLKSINQHHLMIMMGKGHLDNALFKAHTGKSLWQAFPVELTYLLAAGALIKQGDSYLTTEAGQFIALKMFSGFLAGMDYLREQAIELAA
ncbi:MULTISPECIES: coproporphyrinogen III oxidase family protein [unclassified Shewanella]|uniref:coproporphyrinogen III oxidase family protein n=1 Tax=unclassified Shewanella TaxID=196818 RepID=UPI001BC59C1C|nr:MULTISPECIES: coproporphyrinogen III oxidase family protein [unclassified Shewanella]GIU16063.1 coproporphyrinogen III oxidase [Shewanella sp. MBTL60-112-B1]GIU33861.1 coproporphyrinogen III oxidase [Shewanella sp. MBTL60-112-B2]